MLKFKKSFLLFATTTLFIMIFTTTNLTSGSDWQYWANFEINKKISKNLNLIISPQFRIKQNSPISFYWAQAVLGIQWNIKKYFISSFCYQHIRYKENLSWKNEYRPNLSITFKSQLDNFNLSDRNRMEYRIMEDKKIPRYRNKLTIEFPIEEIKLTPNLAYEVFYDFNAKKFNKYRFYFGAAHKTSKSLQISLTYFLDNNYEKRWEQTNVLNFGIKCNF